ncbi:MAG TPA: type II toxin-antitoxin system HipA family toxin [Myxococcota bacterium]|nr:type II toxin-antitoxin system HipA family toxin [Myxococcota bacterium]HOD07885.1 type II toxin-antitoxin system HipA family toxin [Myxococcota bacterium]HPB51246.1 type II toxin-antitoxin system HipA family toxin [Myxococcota bacterium]
MSRLDVYLNLDVVGVLDQNDDDLLEFRYDPSWLTRKDAVPLSRSLPLQEKEFRGKHARAFFAGILPDEGPRRQIAAILGISDLNDFALLERIGGECAGAVSLWPEGVSPPAPERSSRELSEPELVDIIAELPRRPLLAGQDGIRLSLAGAQDKLPVIVLKGGAIALPLGNTPSTHIIKPEPGRFPGLASNEALCMTLARRVGLNVPQVALRSIDGHPCLMVQRYDRVTSEDGSIIRVHQEDFCQAMGFPPERKYQQEGGPLLRQCFAMIREWSSAPVLDIRDFVDGVIFNILIGNADAHAKNYSFLYLNGERRLAPLYDLVCTMAWPDLSKVPAMKVGKSSSMNNVTLSNWKFMAEETRLGWPMLRERLQRMAGRVLSELDHPELRQAAGNDDVFELVSRIIRGRLSSYISPVE